MRQSLSQLFLVLLLSQWARAEVEVRASPQHLIVGQTGTLQILATEARLGQPPELPEIEGLRLRFDGRRMEYYNGVSQTRFTYEMVAEKPGRWELPSLEVESSRGLYQTRPLSFWVEDPRRVPRASLQTGETVFLQTAVLREQIYEGQEVPIEFTLYLEDGIRLLNDPRDLVIQVESEGFILRRPEYFSQSRLYLDRKVFRAYTFKGIIVPLNSGILSFGPPRIDLKFGGRINQRVFPPRQEILERTLRGTALEIRSLPLPEDPPEGFSGAIGSFEMTVSAQPIELQQDEPISLLFTVRGQGNFTSLTPPELTEPQGWKTYELENSDPSNKEFAKAGQRQFSRILRALQPHEAIPPFRFSYFDPETGRYETVQSDPIPLVMTPTPTTLPSSLSRPVETGLQDIIEVTDRTPRPLAQAPLSWRESPSFWLIQGLGASSFLAITLLGLRRRAASRQDQETLALRQEAKRLFASLQTESNNRRELYRLAARLKETLSQLGSPPLLPEEVLLAQASLAYAAPSAEREAAPSPEERQAVVKAFSSHFPTS
ncbi:MAG: BatD family protein [Verrucomicrobiota bacterium]